MSKIRAIHPSFWKDETVADCKPLLRLFYIGLWNFSDDFGVFEWRPRMLKAEILPYDDIDIENLLESLVKSHKIIVLQHDNKLYGYIKNFLKYQKPDFRYRTSILCKPKDADVLLEQLLKTSAHIVNTVLTRRDHPTDGDGDGDGDGDVSAVADAPGQNLAGEKIAHALADGIRKTNPAFAQKFPDDNALGRKLFNWAADIEKLLRIDKATEEQVEFVIRWLFEKESKDAQFWRVNIQSGSKLREKFQTLVGAIQREGTQQAIGIRFIS